MHTPNEYANRIMNGEIIAEDEITVPFVWLVRLFKYNEQSLDNIFKWMATLKRDSDVMSIVSLMYELSQINPTLPPAYDHSRPPGSQGIEFKNLLKVFEKHHSVISRCLQFLDYDKVDFSNTMCRV